MFSRTHTLVWTCIVLLGIIVLFALKEVISSGNLIGLVVFGILVAIAILFIIKQIVLISQSANQDEQDENNP